MQLGAFDFELCMLPGPLESLWSTLRIGRCCCSSPDAGDLGSPRRERPAFRQLGGSVMYLTELGAAPRHRPGCLNQVDRLRSTALRDTAGWSFTYTCSPPTSVSVACVFCRPAKRPARSRRSDLDPRPGSRDGGGVPAHRPRVVLLVRSDCDDTNLVTILVTDRKNDEARLRRAS